jgi:mono/diheme cytochrome c family protein
MSKDDQFRQYAEEAVLRQAQSKAGECSRPALALMCAHVASTLASNRTRLSEMARKYPARNPWPAITLGLVLLCASEAALAEQPAERRGLRFVALHCARCHGIEQNSESPLANAPPFRALHLKYAVADLQRPLAEGIHPSMPLFRLTPGEIEDVMAYLKTLR